MAVAGLSTNGITFGYAISAPETKPSSFTALSRINEISGLTIDTEQIDASALEDTKTKNIAGRDSIGDFSVTVNATKETITEWKTLISAYEEGKAEGKSVWFEAIVPGLTDAYFVVAQPPANLPMPSMGQNELLTMEISLVVEDFTVCWPKFCNIGK